ncbi:MAG: outer membrane protein transport protein, partial [Candidatus Hydrothermae bacterium]|nr:outer membrane protein transport protein [Candidatus Hydrothermae bacterium]
MRSVLKIIIFLSITTTLQAGGFALSGVGSRAIGMAGAFRSISDDWTAIFWNPAGLTQTGYSINLSGIFITPYASLEPNTGILGYDGPYTMRYKVSAKEQNFIIPSFGLITPYEIKEGRLAFGFFVPFGLGSKWDLYDFPMGYYNTEDTTFTPPEMEKYDWQSDIKVFAFYMGISKRFGKASLG